MSASIWTVPVAAQVALKAIQRRLNSSGTDESQSVDEIRRLQGALHQASLQYKQLLLQFAQFQEKSAAHKTSTEDLAELYASNAGLKADCKQSQAQLQQSQQQLQQSQEQLKQHMLENEKMQLLVEKLGKAAAEMHAVVERAEAAPQPRAAAGFSARHNLQAVHDAVHDKLSRYESHSSESEFSSTELLLPALWKPQKERHIAPTGF